MDTYCVVLCVCLSREAIHPVISIRVSNLYPLSPLTVNKTLNCTAEEKPHGSHISSNDSHRPWGSYCPDDGFYYHCHWIVLLVHMVADSPQVL